MKDYYPALAAWGNSPAVRAKHASDESLGRTPAFGKLMGSLMGVGKDFGGHPLHWKRGMDHRGVYEEINNDDLAFILSELYTIKNAIKAFVESPAMKANEALGMATFKDKNFIALQNMLFKDVGVKDWADFQAKMKRVCDKFHSKQS